MSATTIDKPLLRDQLNRADLNALADIAKKIGLGDMLSRVKVVATGLTGAAAFDITTAAFKAASVVTGMQLDTGENLPPIGQLVALQVTTGTAAALGTYIIGPAGTPPAGATVINPTGGAQLAAGIASLSDDGKTLTFLGAAITGITFIYYPKSAVALNTALPASAP